jgi:transposase
MALNSKIQVPLPNKGVIVAKSGRNPYVYHVTQTFRNGKGQPTNTRRSIGKLDAGTGMLIPNDAYYEYYDDAPKGPALAESMDGICEVGVTFLSSHILSLLGVDAMLRDSLGEERSTLVHGVVSYMLSEGNIMAYLDDWCERSLCGCALDDRAASRLFSSVSYAERMAFFRAWVGARKPGECLAYDVTSFSSYARGIEDTEWGYNRDGERLPQINMAMYLGQTSALPLFYVTYPGSIVDKSHLPYMMAHNVDLGVTDVSFVMDRGFASTANAQFMKEKGYPFIMGVENRFKSFKGAIKDNRDKVCSSLHHLKDNKIFGTGVQGHYYGISVTLHIYYAPERASAQSDDLYRTLERQEYELTKLIHITDAQVNRYTEHFDICVRKDRTFSFTCAHDRIDILAADLGYFCILASDVALSSDAVLSIYRNKDVIEKGFDEVKNHLDMKRLRTHNQNTTEGKVFIAFIALIVRMHIRNTLAKWMEKNHFTIERVIRELRKIRTVRLADGRSLLNPFTKKQREIVEAFGADADTVKNYIRL